MPFELPQLPYDYTALEPYIDAQTMEIHHSKHHQAYVTNLNKALETHPDLQAKTLEELITDLAALPADIQVAVRNNGGGHYNHSLFWQLMSPTTTDLEDELESELTIYFGSFETFKDEFAKKALARFGSGWVWLVKNQDKLEIVSTPNQDNPLMENAELKLLLGLDVWEHAYYLKYQNRRADYISEWWKVVNWQKVQELYQA